MLNNSTISLTFCPIPPLFKISSDVLLLNMKIYARHPCNSLHKVHAQKKKGKLFQVIPKINMKLLSLELNNWPSTLPHPALLSDPVLNQLESF